MDELVLVELVTVEPAMAEVTTEEPMPAPPPPELQAAHPVEASVKKAGAEERHRKEPDLEWVDDPPRTTSESLGVPELTSDQHGHATLLDNPAPLSSLLHLPVLIKGDTSSS